MYQKLFRRYLLITLIILLFLTIFHTNNIFDLVIDDAYAAVAQEELSPEEEARRKRLATNLNSKVRLIYPVENMILFEQRDWVTGISKSSDDTINLSVTEMSSGDEIENEALEVEDNGQFTYPVEFAPGENKIMINDVVIYVYYQENEDEPAPEGYKEMLVHQSVPDLCEECHDTFDETRTFPLIIESQIELCENCHRSLIYNRLRKVYKNIHAPVKEGKCTVCHSIHLSENERMLRMPQNELCKTCHESFIKKAKEQQFIHLGNLFDRICSKCHNPHSSNLKTLIRDVRKGICKTCHEAFSGEKKNVEYKSIHKPVVQGKCYLCHELHSGKNKMFLIKSEPNETCIVCHAIKLSNGHGAKLKECTSCHNAHISDKEGLFTEKGINKCLECHKDLNYRKDIPAKANCQSCHTPHSNQNVKLAKESCSNCHEKKTLPKKHSDLTPSYEKCAECHQIHGNIEEGLLKTNTHPLKPLGEKRCKACHTSKDIDTARNVCMECHKGVYEAKHPMTLGIKEKCIECHKVHGGGANKLIPEYQHKPFKERNCDKCHESIDASLALTERAITGELCLTCHDKIDYDNTFFVALQKKKELKKKVKEIEKTTAQEVKAKKGDATKSKSGERVYTLEDLEDPFLSEREKDMIRKKIEEQNSNAPKEEKEEPKVVEKKEGKAEDGSESLDELIGDVKLDLYKNFHKPFKDRQCVKCHESHASKYAGLRRKDKQNLCYSCHKSKERNEKGEDMLSIHQPINDGRCLSCHYPHGSGYPSLLHDSVRDLCFDCHDNFLYKVPKLPQARGGLAAKKLTPEELARFPKFENIHKPITKDGCVVCHNPHSSSSRKLLLAEKNTFFCYKCHPDFTSIENGKKKVSIHKPVREEDCLACHNEHVGDYKYLLKEEQTKLCTITCHKMPAKHHKIDVASIEQMMEIPKDFVVDDKNRLTCTNCHNPHSSVETTLFADLKKRLCTKCHTTVP